MYFIKIVWMTISFNVSMEMQTPWQIKKKKQLDQMIEMFSNSLLNIDNPDNAKSRMCLCTWH
jgi:hypothetical protein